MRAPALLLVLLALTPTALAEAVDVSIEAFPGPVPPAAEPASTNVTVRIACSDLTPGDALSLSAQHRETWITTTMDPAQAHPDAAACDGEYVLDATLHVTLAADAPAFGESVVQVGAILQGARGASSGTQTTRVTAGFRGEIGLAAERTNASGAPGGMVTFPLVVTNRGNGPAKVGFEVAAKNGSVQVPLPASFVLEPSQNQTVQLQAVVPKARGTSDFTLVATPAYAFDSTVRGPGASVTLTVRTEAGAPFPGLAALLAVLAVAAWHFRRPLR